MRQVSQPFIVMCVMLVWCRCDALEQLVDVQMEAEGWGREDIRSMLTNVGAQPQAVHNMLQVCV